jgi:hypothetical protein
VTLPSLLDTYNKKLIEKGTANGVMAQDIPGVSEEFKKLYAKKA